MEVSVHIRHLFKMIILAVCLTGVSSPAFAKIHQISYDQRGLYDQLIKKIKPGDVLVFPNQKRFTLGKRLDGGNRGSSVRVYEIKEEPQFVLRIPKSEQDVPSISHQIEGLPFLKQNGAPVIEVVEVLDLFYMKVERLPANYIRIEDYFKRPDMFEKFKIQIEEALKSFSKKTALFHDISDFGTEQIAYLPDTDRILIFDWGSLSRLSILVRNETIIHIDPSWSRRSLWSSAISGFRHSKLERNLRDKAISLLQEFNQIAIQERKAVVEKYPLASEEIRKQTGLELEKERAAVFGRVHKFQGNCLEWLRKIERIDWDSY